MGKQQGRNGGGYGGGVTHARDVRFLFFTSLVSWVRRDHKQHLFLTSLLLGCHATLPPKKRLLTSEQHSFHEINQSQLPFHFQELFRAKFTLWGLSDHNLVPRVVVPLDQRSENESSGSNHFEITEFCPSGFTAQSPIFFKLAASTAHAWKMVPFQGERRLWERDWSNQRSLLSLHPVVGHVMWRWPVNTDGFPSFV